jgi:selenocysteine lyase/cysteine desulfurase
MGDITRRHALRNAGAAGFLGLAAAAANASPSLPEPALHDRDPEKYWARIRSDQFSLPDWRIFLNNGSLGVAPRPVVAAVTAYLEHAATLASDEYPRWGYETLDSHRTEMAEFAGCSKDELAFTHNATEAMSFIAEGLDLKPRDEIVMTDQEHPSGRGPWLRRQARDGILVREVKLPLPPSSPQQLADLLISGIGPRTRVLSFSGITTTTGLILPVRQICEAARSKGVLTVVDGAHMNGQIPLQLSELGCDLFAGSPHKWLFAPAGCGLLYGRGDMLDRLWPTVVTGNWADKSLKSARFMMVGTNNRALIEGMLAGLRFHKAIGSDRIYTRIHALARTVRERAAASRHLELLTPADDRMYGALVTFRIKAPDVKPLLEACKRKRIWIVESDRMRISTHIHTRPSDIDAFFETLNEVYGP